VLQPHWPRLVVVHSIGLKTDDPASMCINRTVPI